MTETEQAWNQLNESFARLTLEERINDLQKLVGFFETGEYPSAVYDPKLVRFENAKDTRRINILISYEQALEKLKQYKAYYQIKYSDEIYRRKLRETES